MHNISVLLSLDRDQELRVFESCYSVAGVPCSFLVGATAESVLSFRRPGSSWVFLGALTPWDSESPKCCSFPKANKCNDPESPRHFVSNATQVASVGHGDA